jgi:hypothetical protein
VKILSTNTRRTRNISKNGKILLSKIVFQLMNWRRYDLRQLETYKVPEIFWCPELFQSQRFHLRNNVLPPFLLNIIWHIKNILLLYHDSICQNMGVCLQCEKIHSPNNNDRCCFTSDSKFVYNIQADALKQHVIWCQNWSRFYHF